MRLRSILFMPSLPPRERARRLRDWAAGEFAARLPPRVRYWCTLQEIGYATRHSANIPATPVDRVLANMRTPKNLA